MSDIGLIPLLGNQSDLGAMDSVVPPLPHFNPDFWLRPVDPKYYASVGVAVIGVQPKSDIGIQFRVRF